MFSVGDRVYVLFHNSVERTCLSRERPADYGLEVFPDYETCTGTVVCVNALPHRDATCKVENNDLKNAFFLDAEIHASISRHKAEWRQRAATSQMLYCVHLDAPFEFDHEDGIQFTDTPYCPVHAGQSALCPAHGGPCRWFGCLFTIPM